ncbi:dihydroxy-acid dehydratase [Xanthomonas hyacinthi]|uniref:dihydroxy-acid dehydratase domain-containing protein n=1 Tax=Xanthomonas hyacinthi TaxID=56455 RepID=UPI00069DF926|nr:dihydroxy-acid dehydratase [Xanthomonas hyacinthi]
MEDFYYAGGLPAVMRELGAALDLGALTVNGRSLGENVAQAPCWNRAVIHALDTPFREQAGSAVLRGNLAPDGAVIKPSAAVPHLLRHRGRAVVFESIEDMKTRIDDEALDIAPTPARGWSRLYVEYVEHVQQAHLGADLDFLVGGSGAVVARDWH